MQADRTRRDSRGIRLLRWTERLLLLGGAAMLAWLALAVIDAHVAQRAARRMLETVPAADRFAARPAETGIPAEIPTEIPTSIPLPAPVVRRGDPIAGLSIPRLDLSAVVLHGSDDRTLRRGPGHLEDTALPGESGNVAIAGHRDSFFRPLRHVRVGDDIFLDTARGRIHYRVAWLRVVRPSDLSVLEPTDTPALTLITCYPFWVLGNAPDRFIVRATRVTDPAAGASVQATSGDAPLPAPVRERPPAMARAAPTRPPPDDVLVREAIERFRVTYNARQARHELTSGSPLQFHTCEVGVAGDVASAACGASRRAPGEGEPAVWMFRLERVQGRWAIKSVQS